MQRVTTLAPPATTTQARSTSRTRAVEDCILARTRESASSSSLQTRTSLQDQQSIQAVSRSWTRYPSLQVYPGTRAYTWAVENNYLKNTDYREQITADGNHNCLLETQELSAKDLLNFCDSARRQYYLRPRFMFYKLVESIKDPFGEGRKTAKSFRTFAKHIFSNVSDN